jgi:hypothetical protein
MASLNEGAPPDAAPLETVWLFAPLPPLPGWPPDPVQLVLALGSGGLGAGLLYLALEVQRPLRRLEQALAELRFDQEGSLPLPAGGSPAVRSLTARFNAVDFVRIAAECLGGKGGGGRPDMAQAGGPDGAGADKALAAITEALVAKAASA